MIYLLRHRFKEHQRKQFNHTFTEQLRHWWYKDTAVLNVQLRRPFVYWTMRVQDRSPDTGKLFEDFPNKQFQYFSMDPTSLDPEFSKRFARLPKGKPWYKRIQFG